MSEQLLPLFLNGENSINSRVSYNFNEDGNILLKQIKKESLRKDMILIEKVLRSEEQIKKGKVVKADIMMNDEEIDDLLMA